MARPSTAAVRLLTGEREPVRLATTANIILSGLQTIDGVLTEVGDRVLVKNQVDATENGIYTASPGAWYRAADARTARTMQKGTTVHVQQGTVAASHVYSFQTFEPEIGVDDIVLAFVQSDDTVGAVNAAIGDAASAAVAAVQQQLADEVESAEAEADRAELARDAALGAVPDFNPDSLAAMKAGFNSSTHISAYLLDPDRAGQFVFRTGDYTAAAAADPEEGVVVPVDGVDPSVGALFRLYQGAVSVRWFGAKGDGATDDRAACQAAIDYVAAQGGGEVVFPEGTYSIGTVAAPDFGTYGLNNGLVVPFISAEVDNRVRLVAQGDAVLKAASDDMSIVRVSQAGSELIGLHINGGNAYWTAFDNTIGVLVAAEDRADDATFGSSSFFKMERCFIQQCAEGVYYECGPTVASGPDTGAGYGAFYSNFSHCDFNANTRHMWFGAGALAPDNRPTRGNIHFCRFTRGAVGIALEFTTEFLLLGNMFEMLNANYPNSPMGGLRTAIWLGEHSEINWLIGGYAEDCDYTIYKHESALPNAIQAIAFPPATLAVNSGMGFSPVVTPGCIRLTRDAGTNQQLRVEFGHAGYVAMIADYGAAGAKNFAIDINNIRRLDLSTADTYLFPASGPGLTISNGIFFANADNSVALGHADYRFTQLFAVAGSINTSDAREKDWRGGLNDAELRVAKRLSKLIGIYRWKDAIEKKGDAARSHIGVTVQDVMKEFEAEGLEPFDYGMVCYDEWDADEEMGREAGNRYGLRYDELWGFVAAGFEARVAALEEG